MASVSFIDLSKGPLSGKTERGLLGTLLQKLIYEAADDGALRFQVDTIPQGAGSIAFTIDNRNLPQGGTVKIYVHNGEAVDENDTGNMTEVAFKDLTGTETAVGGLATAGGVTAVFTLTEDSAISAGNYKLIYGGQETANIAFGANAATIQAALEALSTIGAGNVTVTGGPVNTTPVVITLADDLALQDVSDLTSDQTGLTGTFLIAESPVGSDGDKANAIITYASYPEVMSSRFFVFEYTPDAAMGIDVEIPVYVSVK